METSQIVYELCLTMKAIEKTVPGVIDCTSNDEFTLAHRVAKMLVDFFNVPVDLVAQYITEDMSTDNDWHAWALRCAAAVPKYTGG